jgi:hypothetical protein
MTKLTCSFGAALLAAGTLACGGNNIDPERDDTTPAATVGTSGDAADVQKPAAPDDALQRPSDLPSTASPLMLTGLLGLLSLTAGVGVRWTRRR